ncbi:hypothetical protein PR048_032212 [Dryococelus australis]|uniref:Peptidase aspartic putative domain-containing protein n=1 Tax=Dryococelus australis TaxID=614101 RepID=A0ABQ9G5P6_9NEOP|nr:hypothetical protein PR048_032212 [Dryococelus australis]
MMLIIRLCCRRFAKAVISFTITANTHPTACSSSPSIQQAPQKFLEKLKLLTKWHDNKRAIMANHIEDFLQAPVAASDSAQYLRGLLSAIIESVAELKTLNLPVDQWDMLLLHLLEKRIGHTWRKQWGLVVHELDIPKLSDFSNVLQKYCMPSEVMDSTFQKHGQPKSINTRKVAKQHRISSGSFFVNSLPEKFCLSKGDHAIHRFPEFVGMDFQARFSARHNTTLHFPSAQDKNSALSVLSYFPKDLQPYDVVLPTAVAYVQDVCGNCQPVRVLLDSGSQHQKLAIPRQALSHAPLTSAKVVVSSNISPSGRKEALVLQQMTSHVRLKFLKRDVWKHIKQL